MVRRPQASWSPEAIADLHNLWDYYSPTAGASTAARILRDIAKAILVIEEHPLAGRSRDEIRPGLRSLAVNPHVIFYRVHEERPEVVRVLDGRQDLEDIFAEGDGQ